MDERNYINHMDEPATLIALSGVVVRQIEADERERWDALMRRHHYLGFNRTAGRALRQVAEYQGKWLALLLWQASALMCAPRDNWINGLRPIQLQRLHLIANNARFLILPEGRIPNLASRVLSLSRLSSDWQAFHGHPVLLAETFVDPARFHGGCYRAANWLCLGLTRGYARHAGHYAYHGQPKTIWIYPLHRRARQGLRHPLPPPDWSQTLQNVELSTLEMEPLREPLRQLPEPRGGRRPLHPLPTVLVIALAATLAGARGYLAISEFAARLDQAQLKRLRTYFDRKLGSFVAPSEPTIRRVLQQVDPQSLERAFSTWVRMGAPEDEPLAVDGKTLKGARRPDGSQVHLLSALFHHQGGVVAQCEIDAKTNSPGARQPAQLHHRPAATPDHRRANLDRKCHALLRSPARQSDHPLHRLSAGQAKSLRNPARGGRSAPGCRQIVAIAVATSSPAQRIRRPTLRHPKCAGLCAGECGSWGENR